MLGEHRGATSTRSRTGSGARATMPDRAASRPRSLRTAGCRPRTNSRSSASAAVASSWACSMTLRAASAAVVGEVRAGHARGSSPGRPAAAGRRRAGRARSGGARRRRRRRRRRGCGPATPPAAPAPRRGSGRAAHGRRPRPPGATPRAAHGAARSRTGGTGRAAGPRAADRAREVAATSGAAPAGGHRRRRRRPVTRTAGGSRAAARRPPCPARTRARPPAGPRGGAGISTPSIAPEPLRCRALSAPHAPRQRHRAATTAITT